MYFFKLIEFVVEGIHDKKKIELDMNLERIKDRVTQLEIEQKELILILVQQVILFFGFITLLKTIVENKIITKQKSNLNMETKLRLLKNKNM